MPRSKSPAASKKKPAAAAAETEPSPLDGICSASTAIKATGAWWMLIGTTALVAPGFLLKQYQVPLEGLDADINAKAMVFHMFQSFGGWMVCWAGIQSLTTRVGNESSMSKLCLCNCVCMALGLVMSHFKINPLLAALGMPAAGSNFNMALNILFLTMNFCGWHASGSEHPDFSLLLENPQTASKSSTATRYVILLGVIFGGAMTFNPDALMAQYKVPADGVLKPWMSFIMALFGMVLFNVTLALSTTLSMDSVTISNANRFMWCFLCMEFVQSASQTTTNMLMGDKGMPVDGIYFNCALWAVGSLLCFRAMVTK